ncbi:MAG: hypothetical protein ACOYLH_07845 [Flavobacteriales bacterium]
MKKLSIFLAISLVVACLSGLSQSKSGDVKSGSASKSASVRVSSSASSAKMNTRTGTSARSNSAPKMKVGDSNTAHRPHRTENYTKPNYTHTAPAVPQPVVDVPNAGDGIFSVSNNQCGSGIRHFNPYAYLLPASCQWLGNFWNHHAFGNPAEQVEDNQFNEELILMNTSDVVLTVEVEFSVAQNVREPQIIVLQPGESFKVSQRYVYLMNEMGQTAIGKLHYDRYNVRVYVGTEVSGEPIQSANGVCVDQNIYLSLTPNGVN